MSHRKVAIAAASGVTYVASVYLSFLYFGNGSNTNEEKPLDETAGPMNPNGVTPSKTSSISNFSYVNDPNRTQTFQRIASCYDDDIGRDEIVMGMLFCASLVSCFVPFIFFHGFFFRFMPMNLELCSLLDLRRCIRMSICLFLG
mmetsp:Transcript_28235/g.28610  ORF Transcript_28235/g.28610 Transcript_28235/m.28610 type:complete len:144 (-) Transcript_28235:290-721(-)